MPTALNKAKKNKIDEFYTLYADVEEELRHYAHLFEGKTVYCCCDDPRSSNFYLYLCKHFNEFGMKEVIASCKAMEGEPAYWASKTSDANSGCVRLLGGSGNFNSPKCRPFWNRADIIVTNPPFSQTKHLLKLIKKKQLDFIIVGNRNLITCRDVFPDFLKGEVRFGFGFIKDTAFFEVPESLTGRYSSDVIRTNTNKVRFRNVTWFTSFDMKVPHKQMFFAKTYDPFAYPKYDQFDAINVDRIADIPIGYDGIMGVPITILDKFDYERFELIGLDRYVPGNPSGKRFSINGKEKYARVLIRWKSRELP